LPFALSYFTVDGTFSPVLVFTKRPVDGGINISGFYNDYFDTMVLLLVRTQNNAGT
jgi:hypothetical protein